MAGRYLIMAGKSPSPTPAEPPWSANGLQQVLSTPELRLIVSSEQRWRHWPNHTASIVGNVYTRPSPGMDRSSDQPNLDGGFDERGLLASCWGDYVSLRMDGHELKVMRDPSGALPCFFVLAEGAVYLASDVSLLVRALGKVPAIDWDQLTRLLYVNDLPEERTALAGIRELLPGHVLTFVDGRAEAHPIWSPWDHVAHDDGPTTEQLEQCVRQCVRTVASPFHSVLVGVSGGLDSSIVAACLAGSNSDVHPITISTDDPRGDEAGFAQVLCDHLGLPLIRDVYRLKAVDITRSTVAHLPRPGGRAQLQAYDAAVLAAASRTGASAFLSGVGGDNVFYYTNSARALVDHYLERGLSRHVLTTLRNICQLAGCTIGQALKQAIEVPRGAEPCKYRWPVDGRFLRADRVADLSSESLSHPWLVGPRTSRPGRAAHIAMILRAQHYLDAQDREGPLTFLQPLLAQPLVELCLAIPSWRAIANGRDRAVARQAFAASLPATIINRRIKGGPDGFAHQIIRENLPTIRERLLDGVLADQRLLDLPALERALREENLMGGDDYVRILLLLDTEAWARHWIARRGAVSPMTAV